MHRRHRRIISITMNVHTGGGISFAHTDKLGISSTVPMNGARIERNKNVLLLIHAASLDAASRWPRKNYERVSTTTVDDVIRYLSARAQPSTIRTWYISVTQTWAIAIIPKLQGKCVRGNSNARQR